MRRFGIPKRNRGNTGPEPLTPGDTVEIIANLTDSSLDSFIGVRGTLIRVMPADDGWHDKAGHLPYMVKLSGRDSLLNFGRAELKRVSPETPLHSES